MMNHLRFAPAAALAAAAILGFALATPATADPARRHGPVHPHRNDDGSLMRGPQFTLVTENWAGYAVANYQTGQTYTAAQATWVVAPVTFGQTKSVGSDEYAASWVGIGGYCANASCTIGDPTLIQLGTQSDVPAGGGAATYSAWYEMLPSFPVTIPLAIHAGDEVTASLQCAPCLEKKQTWTLTMSNRTTHKTWSHTFDYASSLLSAEWIEEAPVAGGILPLADFNVAQFAAASANGVTPVITFGDNGIAMVDPWGQVAVPTAPDGRNDGFDVCWAFEALGCTP